MNKTIELDFCVLDIRNQIVIANINEGVHLTSELSEDIILAVFNLLGNKPTVYITSRTNSYSVDPTLYTNISKIKNIIGFGIITDDTNIDSKNIQVENLFYKNKFNVFSNIDDAILWAEKKLASY